MGAIELKEILLRLFSIAGVSALRVHRNEKNAKNERNKPTSEDK